jgi:hypothetical protein
MSSVSCFVRLGVMKGATAEMWGIGLESSACWGHVK